MKTQMHLVYHSRDFDGLASATIALMHFNKIFYDRPSPVELHPWDYGQTPPEIPEGDNVTVMDISLPFEWMEAHPGLVWIDHHITAINDANKRGYVPNGLRNPAKSACELTWEFYNPDLPMPKWVSVLGRYDRWDKSDPKEWDEVIVPFQMGAKVWVPLTKDAVVTGALAALDFHTDAVISNGRTIIAYEKMMAAEIMRGAHPIELCGLRGIACNTSMLGSRQFDSVAADYDFCCGYRWVGDAKKWRISFYTDKPGGDVSGIAKSLGGGGHKGASGCTVDKLPWEAK